jgi:hypothetical protein
MMHHIFPRCVLALGLGLLTACSSFDRQWKGAGDHHGKSSRWEGTWTSAKHKKSDGSPEGGRLRCVLEPVRDQKLAAHFHANWLVFSSNYSTTLAPVTTGPQQAGVRHYQGTQMLPKMFGGVYHYDATIRGDHFICKYTSSYDHGVFTLHRAASPMEHFRLHPEH